MSYARINSPLDDDALFANSLKRLTRQPKEKTQKQIIKGYWNSMNNRIKTPLYNQKQIKVLWSFEEFTIWFNNNWERFHKIKEAGETPSIDRINSDLHYCESNCRLIPMSVNSALGEVNAIVNRMKTLQEFLNANSHWLKN